MKYRKIVVNIETYYDEVFYTIDIQVKKWYGWVTIKTMESNDLKYLNIEADDILDKLESNVY